VVLNSWLGDEHITEDLGTMKSGVTRQSQQFNGRLETDRSTVRTNNDRPAFQDDNSTIATHIDESSTKADTNMTDGADDDEADEEPNEHAIASTPLIANMQLIEDREAEQNARELALQNQQNEVEERIRYMMAETYKFEQMRLQANSSQQSIQALPTDATADCHITDTPREDSDNEAEGNSNSSSSSSSSSSDSASSSEDSASNKSSSPSSNLDTSEPEPSQDADEASATSQVEGEAPAPSQIAQTGTASSKPGPEEEIVFEQLEPSQEDETISEPATATATDPASFQEPSQTNSVASNGYPTLSPSRRHRVSLNESLTPQQEAPIPSRDQQLTPTNAEQSTALPTRNPIGHPPIQPPHAPYPPMFSSPSKNNPTIPSTTALNPKTPTPSISAETAKTAQVLGVQK
jgi:hypothetical protein